MLLKCELMQLKKGFLHSKKCLERVLKYCQFSKPMIADFFVLTLILIALAHTLIALVHTSIELAHTSYIPQKS